MGGYWPAQNETSGTEEWQGAVATPADLPTTAQINETREVADDGDGQAAMYSWDGSTWIKIADPDAASVVDLQTAYTGSATPTPIVFTAAKHLTFTGSTSGSWAWTAETMDLTQTGTGTVTLAGLVAAQLGLDVTTAPLTAAAGINVSAGTVDLGAAVTAAAGEWHATTMLLSASGALTITGGGALILQSAEATADAVRIYASDAAGGIDVDSGATSGALAMNGGGAATITYAGISLVAGAGAMVATGATGSFGDTTGTIDFSSGAVTDTAVASYNLTPTGACDITAGAASTIETTTGTLNIGGNNTTQVNLASVGARQVYVGSLTTTAGTFLRAGTNGFQVDSNGSMSFDSKNTCNLTMTADDAADKTLTIQAINSGAGDAFINIQADNGATVTGDLTVTGALPATIVPATVSKSAAYTIDVADYAIEAQTGAGAYDITLPTLASATAGQEFECTRCGTNLIRLVGNGAELISGVNAQPLNAQWDSIKVRCNAAKTYWIKVIG